MNGKKILFLGTHGQYNIGDELLLETFLEELGDQHSYAINSYDPEFTARQLAGRYNASVFHTTEGKWQLPKLIWQSDLLFFGGGSVIKELYKNVGRNRYATLMMILVITTFAHLLARKPIIMSNIGVGPIHSRIGLLLAKLTLRQATLVSVRDQKSFQTCRSLGLNSERLLLTPDAVFVNQPAKFGQVQTADSGRENKLRIALNLNYNIENSANWQLFLERLALGLKEVNKRQAIEIHALPMQAGFKPNTDLEVLQAFQKEIEDDIEMMVHEPSTPLEVGRIISQCDLVVAERLHSLVIAAILKKPFVALIYDVKVQQLVEFLGMDQYAIDINRPFDYELLANHILAVYKQRSQLTERVASVAG
ncbi:MAG: polysaccharide pyruvyl transferase family protein, partial [Chloroflexota bacterium]